jgi:type IV secretory pathway TraG/TraD family ATPase VirD4
MNPLALKTAEPLLLLATTTVPMAITLIATHAKPRLWLYALPTTFATTLISALTWTPLRAYLTHAVSLPPNPEALYAAGLLYFALLGLTAGLLISPKRPDVEHKRGTVIEDGRGLQRRGRAARRNGRISLAGIPLDPFDETKHVKLIGTTGTGKSTAIRELLAAALDRGDRVILADPDGGYASRFYDAAKGDALLNPFDPRSARWDLFGEIREPYDVEQLARALIPDNEGEERSWRNYGRTFLAATTRRLWEIGQRKPGSATVPELYRLLTMATTEELAILLEGTPARTYLEGGNERMFGSIRSVTATYVAALDHLSRSTGQPLSIRGIIRPTPNQRPVRALFLPYSATQIAALRSTISAWLRLAIFETMNGPERAPGDPQRLWFIVDELDALGAIDGLKDALARLRKFGGCCVLGFQSIAQVSSTYGAGEAQTIVENCGNTLILRCSASEQGGTARFASRLIGDREVIRAHETRSRRPGEWRSSRSFSSQHVTEAAVLPSEIEQLPDLAGYLKVASSPIWQRISMPPG